MHNNKLCTLSEDQDRPLFNVKNTVLTHGLEKQPPAYVLETLELGPRSAVQDTFDPKTILTELDLFLEHCEYTLTFKIVLGRRRQYSKTVISIYLYIL